MEAQLLDLQATIAGLSRTARSVANATSAAPAPPVTTAEDSEVDSDDQDPLQDKTLQAPLHDMLQGGDSSRRHGPHPPDAGESAGTHINAEPRPPRPTVSFNRGQLAQRFLDPVDMGLCLEAEGRRLFNLWVSA